MGSAGTGSSFVDSCGESSSGANSGTNEHRLMRFRRRLVLTAAVSAVLCPFLTSCGGFFIKPSISSIFIQPSAATVGVGQQVSLAAFATYSDGTQNQISGSSVGWSSSAPNIATITSPGGQATGVAIGTATMTASSQGITGTGTVNVTLSNITSLVINTTPGKHPETNHSDDQRNDRHPAVLRLRQWECPERRDAIGNLDFVEHRRGDHQSAGRPAATEWRAL